MSKNPFVNRIVGYTTKRASDLTANPANWRKHPERQRQAVQASLRELGWIGAVVENVRTGYLVDGHERVWQALANDEEVPVLQVDLSEAEERLALSIFDPITYMAETDAAQLDALLKDVSTGEAALQSLLAELADQAGLYQDTPKDLDDQGPQVDRAEELRQKWQVEAGQLWQLGEHRLICGDCTEAEVVARVMGGERADCTVTDPPYGVGVDYSDFDDNAENVKALIKGFMPIVLEMGPAALTPGVPAMWDYSRPSWVGAWVHPASTSSGAWGFVGANPILYYGKDPFLSAGKGRRDSSFVMVADRKGEDDHPVSKPLNVWTWLIERMTPDSGAIVYEPFSGSGTTLIACEQLGRRCRAVEISPAYVAVALERWATATGKTPVLLA